MTLVDQVVLDAIPVSGARKCTLVHDVCDARPNRLSSDPIEPQDVYRAIRRLAKRGVIRTSDRNREIWIKSGDKP